MRHGLVRPAEITSAFSLVELVVVVLIIGILAGVAVPVAFDHAELAAQQAVVTQAQEIFDAAEMFYAYNGSWPSDASRSRFPDDFEGLLGESIFTAETPIGDYYDWDGPDSSRPGVGVAILTDIEICESIDERVDDGDLDTGWVQRIGGTLKFILVDN